MYFSEHPKEYSSLYDAVILKVNKIEESPIGSVEYKTEKASPLDPQGLSSIKVTDLTELVNEKNKKILPKNENLKENGENAEKNNPEAEKTFEDTRPEEQRKRSEAAKDFGKVKKTVAGDEFILYDGTNVDMTKKVYHHRQMTLEDIAAIYENGGTSEDFVSEGNIKKEGNTLTIKTAPTAAQTAQLKELLGEDYTGYMHRIDKNGFEHIEKRHGLKGEHDHTMANLNDVARIGYVMQNADSVEIDTRTDGETNYLSKRYMDSQNKPMKNIKYTKKINGTMHVVVAVGENNTKSLWVVTSYLLENEKSLRAPNAENSTLGRTSETNTFPETLNKSIPENAEENNLENEKTFEDTRPEEQRKRSEAAKDFGKVKKTVAGDEFILYDGTNVDMTKKVYHHRQMTLEDIAAIYENGGTSEDFVSEGNIKKEGNTLTIKTAHTAAQTAQIENFVKINKGDVKLNINGDIRFDLKGVNGEYVTALLAGIYDESGRNVVFSGNMINIKGKPTAGDYKAIEYYVNEQKGDFGIIAQTI